MEMKKYILILFMANYFFNLSAQVWSENYCLNFLNELAEKAHLSKFHFQRKFKKSNGLTIGQLKQQEKTIKAKTLLEKGKMSTDVAYELGFFDQSHFIKYFKKMWATTPKNFK